MSRTLHFINIGRQHIAAGLLFITLGFSASVFALDLDQIVAKVQHDQGGQVLDVQQVTVQHAKAYRIKLLQPSGRVKVLVVDAQSGRYLNADSEK